MDRICRDNFSLISDMYCHIPKLQQKARRTLYASIAKISRKKEQRTWKVKKNLFLAEKEPDIEVAKRYVQRAFEIMKQESLEWWI